MKEKEEKKRRRRRRLTQIVQLVNSDVRTKNKQIF
jgi:hypothetical protein